MGLMSYHIIFVMGVLGLRCHVQYNGPLEALTPSCIAYGALSPYKDSPPTWRQEVLRYGLIGRKGLEKGIPVIIH